MTYISNFVAFDDALFYEQLVKGMQDTQSQLLSTEKRMKRCKAQTPGWQLMMWMVAEGQASF